ncbi:hypothetical protein [Collinsella sp. LCP19S3_B11]|uniref:hypothetical protein n=1 Tax=Collinsella sp. LCP19S3_B11 TaxID=3438754 RepID=UPI003F931705
MPRFITKTDRDTLKCALSGINSYLNFVDEAEDRSDGNVSVPERAMHAWVTTINDVIESIDHRNKERLESIPEHYRGDGFITCDMALAAMLARATSMAMPPMVIFWWANSFKYLWRWAYKGDCKGDLNKAIDCIERVRDWQKTR